MTTDELISFVVATWVHEDIRSFHYRPSFTRDWKVFLDLIPLLWAHCDHWVSSPPVPCAIFEGELQDANDPSRLDYDCPTFDSLHRFLRGWIPSEAIHKR